MFMRSMFVFFNFSESRTYFFFDYISAAAAFMMIGLILVKVLTGENKKSKSGK